MKQVHAFYLYYKNDQYLLTLAHIMAKTCSFQYQKTNRMPMRYYAFGAPEEIRTPDPQIRSLVLYPTELRALIQDKHCP